MTGDWDPISMLVSKKKTHTIKMGSMDGFLTFWKPKLYQVRRPSGESQVLVALGWYNIFVLIFSWFLDIQIIFKGLITWIADALHDGYVMECNANCPCDVTCANRIIQRGPTVPVCVFRTHDRFLLLLPIYKSKHYLLFDLSFDRCDNCMHVYMHALCIYVCIYVCLYVYMYVCRYLSNFLFL